MKKTKLVVTICGGLLLCASSVLAHHGMAAIFNVNEKITAKGTLTNVAWTNPHIGLELDIKDADGKVGHWMMETSPPNWYTKDGVTKAEFDGAIGKEITIIYLKALDGSKYGYLERITFPTGVTGYSMNGAKDRDKKSIDYNK